MGIFVRRHHCSKNFFCWGWGSPSPWVLMMMMMQFFHAPGHLFYTCPYLKSSFCPGKTLVKAFLELYPYHTECKFFYLLGWWFFGSEDEINPARYPLTQISSSLKFFIKSLMYASFPSDNMNEVVFVLVLMNKRWNQGIYWTVCLFADFMDHTANEDDRWRFIWNGFHLIQQMIST